MLRTFRLLRVVRAMRSVGELRVVCNDFLSQRLFAALWKAHKSHTSSYNLLVHTRTLDFSSERAHAQANSGASAAQVTARVFSSSAAVINCMGLVIFVDVRRVLILRFAVEVAYFNYILARPPGLLLCKRNVYS